MRLFALRERERERKEKEKENYIGIKRLLGDFLWSLEQRPDVHVESKIGKPSRNHLWLRNNAR
jgi:hypothetical protein